MTVTLATQANVFAIDLNVEYLPFPASATLTSLAGSGVWLGNGIVITAAHNFIFSKRRPDRTYVKSGMSF